MKETLHFSDRQALREWLKEHSQSSEGVWLLFGKSAAVVTVKAGEALEEALCFGWIDGVMKKIDEDAYQKYFAPRRQGSNWSAKNKALAESLIARGLMTDVGALKIAEAKENGQWAKAAKPAPVSEEQIMAVSELLQGNQLAYENFLGMSPSVRKTYTKAYFAAKTEAGRQQRLTWMTERLEKNLKPM